MKVGRVRLGITVVVQDMRLALISSSSREWLVHTPLPSYYVVFYDYHDVQMTRTTKMKALPFSNS